MPGQTGFLLPPRDIHGLAVGLDELAADAALRDRLGAEGRQRFTDVFRHRHMTHRNAHLYQRLLEE